MFSTALIFLRGIRSGPDIRILYADAAIQSQARGLFARYGSGGANAVDCVSFVIMRNPSIKKAFTFDEHFRAAGFEIPW